MARTTTATVSAAANSLRDMATEARRDQHGAVVFQFNYLPPSVNDLHHQRADGGKALTDAARTFQRDCQQLRDMVKFRPTKMATYAVFMWFWFPDWNADIDNRIKPFLDGILGSRVDQRVIRLGVHKYVAPGRTWAVARVLEVQR
jgi:hypothetical protein